MKVKSFCKITGYICLFLYCSASCVSFAEVFAQQGLELSSSRISELAQTPLWRQLLRYDKNGVSAINSDSFFLAANGRNDPEAELSALIALYAPRGEVDSDLHPRCRFPARYYWLEQQFPEISSPPQNRFVPEQCRHFYRWSLLDQLDSLSLMLVSGYLGNPASVFGHTFLKLNVGGRSTDLFDLSISYGALVPEDELIPLYIFRGLSGGYQAGFSDKYLYNEDQVYSHTEFRDIWEYKLNLSPEQRAFILMQLWEIIGKKRDYYFLNRNCAWQQAELLDTVVKESLAQHGLLWYLPVETFFRMQEIDDERKEKKEPPLVTSVTYHPSSQRVLLHYFSQLSGKEQRAVVELIQSDLAWSDQGGKNFSVSSLTKVLNACLAWYRYREIAEPEAKKKNIQLKNKVLLKLLELPAQKESLFEELEEKSPPTSKNPPQYIGIGFGYSDLQRAFFSLHWSPFSRNLLGSNTLDGDELVVFETEMGIGGAEDSLFLSRLDFIRVRKSQLESLPFDDEWKWSWQLRLATERNGGEQDLLFSFAPGQTWQLWDTVYLYSQLDSSLHSLYPHVRVKPEAGFFWQSSALLGLFSIGFVNRDAGLQLEMETELALQWNISPTLAVALQIDQAEDFSSAMQVKYFW